jgi:hypothetical protein
VGWICCQKETHLTEKGKHSLKVKKWKMTFQANGTQNQAGIPVLLSDNSNAKQKLEKTKKVTLYWEREQSIKRR